MNKLKFGIKASVALLLLLSVFLPLGVGVTAAEDKSSFGKYDFTHKGAYENKVLSAADLLEIYLGEELDEREEAFVDAFAKLSFTYSDLITTEYVAVTYEQTARELRVEAYPYSYEAESGELSWIPSSVKYGGAEYAFGANYELSIENVDTPDADTALSIIYKAESSIDKSDVGALVNLYHDTAKYIFLTEEYEENTRLYAEYLHAKNLYDEAAEMYSVYLEELGEYEAATKAEEDYYKSLEEYNEAYAEYVAYLASYEEYLEKMETYGDHLALRKIAENQLLALDLTKTKMTDGRSLYAAIMGGSVDGVIENKSLIVAAGADGSMVDLAGDSTESVRVLLKNYFALKTEEERYNYYIVNYENLCKSFLDLTVSLDGLYRIPKVRGMLIAEGKDRKYIILVAQLALVTTALIDGPVKDCNGNVAFSGNWKIEKKTVSQILENKTYIEDTDSGAPLSSGYPKPQEEPVAPTVIENPKKPERPPKPVAPQTVEKPGEAPTVVEKPSLPQASGLVLDIYAKLSEEHREQILGWYQKGEISEREERDENYILTLTSSVEKSVLSEKVSVRFMSGVGGELLFSAEIDKGSFAVFEGEVPEKATDALGVYTFGGWRNENGEAINLKEINSDTTLYPEFLTLPFSYDVTWIVDGKTLTERYVSGSTPQCPLSLAKAEERDYYYVFSGWDKPIEIVSCDVTYTAVYERTPIMALSSGAAEILDDGKQIVCDAYASFDKIFPVGEILRRAAGGRSVTLRTIHGNVKFSYSDVIKLKEASVAYIEINTVSRGASGNVYTVEAYDSEMKLCTAEVIPEVYFGTAVKNFANAVLYQGSPAEGKYVKFKSEDGVVSFKASLNIAYTLDLEFSVHAASTELVSLIADKMTARPGEQVKVSVKPIDGVDVSKILVTTASAEVPLLADNSFYMPMGDVNIAAVARYKTYTVIFTSDNMTIVSLKLKHGEKIVPPADPKRENDEFYSYKFIGWSDEVGEAVEDKVFSALYEKTPLPPKERPKGIILSDTVWRLLIVGVASVSGVIALIAIPVVILIVKVRRKKSKSSVENAQVKSE